MSDGVNWWQENAHQHLSAVYNPTAQGMQKKRNIHFSHFQFVGTNMIFEIKTLKLLILLLTFNQRNWILILLCSDSSVKSLSIIFVTDHSFDVGSLGPDIKTRCVITSRSLTLFVCCCSTTFDSMPCFFPDSNKSPLKGFHGYVTCQKNWRQPRAFRIFHVNGKLAQW